MEAKPGSDAEHPVGVSWLARTIAGWIGRLGSIWVDGQLSEVSRRGGNAFLVLRDNSEDASMRVFAVAPVLRGAGQLEQGDRVLVHAKVDFWTKRGELVLKANQIRKVGLGEWLAELERLRVLLDAEGLFRPERKRPLPFLPNRIGLVCGRDSDAEHDVITNARLRWPAAQFEVRHAAVQGVRTVSEVVAALRELDADPAVDVIVIARGGGSVEDLLPFSNEALVRAVAAAGTPVVSAIGHERDSPLLDLVADLRASTPTDAGKRIVPDLAEQQRLVRELRGRARASVLASLERESHRIADLRSRPVLAAPLGWLQVRQDSVEQLLARSRRSLRTRIEHDEALLRQLGARVRSLSPAATLERGYAVVQAPDGAVVRRPDQVGDGDRLDIRLASGRLAAIAVRED